LKRLPNLILKRAANVASLRKMQLKIAAKGICEMMMGKEMWW
jgi:hypothetical protein